MMARFLNSRTSQLRIIATAILVAGLACAAVIYSQGTPREDYSSDPATAGAYKRESRQLEMNYGKVGVLMYEVVADLKAPGGQAATIAIVAVLLASGIFYWASALEKNG